MMISARALQPAVVDLRSIGTRDHAPAVSTAATNGFRLAALAVALQFLASSNALYVMGISYDVAGGNPLVKFHPATYLAILAALSAMRGRGGITRMVHEAPAYVVFVAAMLLCEVSATISIGTTGAAIFVETYVSAGLLSLPPPRAGRAMRVAP